jgi:hypothetical protein
VSEMLDELRKHLNPDSRRIDGPNGVPLGDDARNYTDGWRMRMRGDTKPSGVWQAEGWLDADYRLQHDKRYADHYRRDQRQAMYARKEHTNERRPA